MKSTLMKSTEPSTIATAVRELRTPSIPWWGVLSIDAMCAVIFAVVVAQGLVTGRGLTWHIAAIIGIALGELVSAAIQLFFTLRWRGQICDGVPVAYEPFNSYISASDTPLDQKNVPAAAKLICELVTKRGMNAHMWHAATSALLCVPAWLSVLATATEQGATQEQMRSFMSPMFVVVGLSVITLLVSLVGIFIQQAGLSEWVVEVAGRRITSITRAIDENAQGSSPSARPAVQRETREQEVPQTPDDTPARSSSDTAVEEVSMNPPSGHYESQPRDQHDSEDLSIHDEHVSSGSERPYDESVEPPDETQTYTGRRRRDNSRFGE